MFTPLHGFHLFDFCHENLSTFKRVPVKPIYFARKSFHLCPEFVSTFGLRRTFSSCHFLENHPEIRHENSSTLVKYCVFWPWKSFHLYIMLFFWALKIFPPLRFTPWFSFHLTLNRFPPNHESVSPLLWKCFHLALNRLPPLILESLEPQWFQPPVNKKINKKTNIL